METTTAPNTISKRELAEITAANESGRQPVVFIHGLWLLASSWDEWRPVFERAGYATVAIDWPDDPTTVEEARRDPSIFAGKSIGAITDHIVSVIDRLTRKPILVGHSFGGLLAQKLAGMGRSISTVAIDPAPFRGVLPLPFSALKASSAVLSKPSNYRKAVALTEAQFEYAFANAVPQDEAERLYETFHVAGPGIPLFQAATANLNPRTEASVDTTNPERGPLLIMSGEHDHTVPWAIANASYRRQRRNASITEIVEIPGRGHSLVIDHGWGEVAEQALAFIQRTTALDEPKSGQ